LTKFKVFIDKIFPDKKTKIFGILFLIIIISAIIFSTVYFFMKSSRKKPSVEELISNYVTMNLQTVASVQKMGVSIDTNYGLVEFTQENRRDKDTDHLMIEYKSPLKKSSEMYIDKVDKQIGIYLKKSNNKWNFELKPKQSAVDDPRTEYIEVNGAADNMSLTDFTELEFKNSDIENTYLCTAKITGYTMLNMLANNYQSIYVNYDSLASYFAKYNGNITFDCRMYFDIKTNKLVKSIFSANEVAFKEANTRSVDVMINSFQISLSNDSFDKSNVYVSEDIEKNTTTVKSLQSDDLTSIIAKNKNLNFKYVITQVIEINKKDLDKYTGYQTTVDKNGKLKYTYTQYILSDNAYEITNGIELIKEKATDEYGTYIMSKDMNHMYYFVDIGSDLDGATAVLEASEYKEYLNNKNK
jgi:hypothetical protein